MFSTKISGAAGAVGVPFRPAGSAEALQARLQRVEDGKLNEPVTGVMIDLELGDAAMAMIQAAKAHGGAAVIAFGSHVATDVLAAAKDAGADLVLPRSSFAARLPELLREHGGAEL